MDLNSKTIVVIQGGLGAEREISLRTGEAFQNALKKLNLKFTVIDAQEDLPVQLVNSGADIALLALHGKYAEDGVVQGICEYLKIPYTGSGVLASALCMDKVYSKQIYVQNNIPTPKYQVIDSHLEDLSTVKVDGKVGMTFPLVVKPSREGSSVGVSIVKNENGWAPALLEAAKYDHHILVEEFIDGLELTIPLLDGKALTSIEIQPKVDFYDYTNKYTEGKTEYHLPARVSEDQEKSYKAIAEKVYQVCRLQSYGRVDFRVAKNGDPYVIEVNTLPGCTSTSLLPQAAKHCGVSFESLIEKLLQSARLDYEGLR